MVTVCQDQALDDLVLGLSNREQNYSNMDAQFRMAQVTQKNRVKKKTAKSKKMTFVAYHLHGTARDGEKITTSWSCLTCCSSETQHPENLNVRNSFYGKYNYLSITRFSEIVSHKFEVVGTPPRPLPSCKTNFSIVFFFFLTRWREDVTFFIRQYNIIGWILRYSQYLQAYKEN